MKLLRQELFLISPETRRFVKKHTFALRSILGPHAKHILKDPQLLLRLRALDPCHNISPRNIAYSPSGVGLADLRREPNLRVVKCAKQIATPSDSPDHVALPLLCNADQPELLSVFITVLQALLTDASHSFTPMVIGHVYGSSRQKDEREEKGRQARNVADIRRHASLATAARKIAKEKGKVVVLKG